MKKKQLNINLEQDLIFHNYIYELYMNEISITNYKKHLIKNSFEKYLLDSLEDEDFILSSSLYYLYYLILNERIITNPTLNYLTVANKDMKAEMYGDILNIMPLCCQIFALLNHKDNSELNEKLFSIYKLCKKLNLLSHKLTGLYVRDGVFINEIQNGYLELIRKQLKSDAEDDFLFIHNEIKELKKHLISKEMDLFDVFQDLNKTLFSKYYNNLDKDKTSIVKISNKPFIYWNETKNNLMSNINLHFIGKTFKNFDKELEELKKIETTATSMLFFLEYEESLWKQKSYNAIALKFFMDKENMMKYSYIAKNEEDLKSFLKRYYNYTSIGSYSFSRRIIDLISDVVNNNNDLTLAYKELSRKLPYAIAEDNFIITTNEKEDLINALALKIYEIFIEESK